MHSCLCTGQYYYCAFCIAHAYQPALVSRMLKLDIDTLLGSALLDIDTLLGSALLDIVTLLGSALLDIDTLLGSAAGLRTHIAAFHLSVEISTTGWLLFQLLYQPATSSAHSSAQSMLHTPPPNPCCTLLHPIHAAHSSTQSMLHTHGGRANCPSGIRAAIRIRDQAWRRCSGLRPPLNFGSEEC